MGIYEYNFFLFVYIAKKHHVSYLDDVKYISGRYQYLLTKHYIKPVMLKGILGCIHRHYIFCAHTYD